MTEYRSNPLSNLLATLCVAGLLIASSAITIDINRRTAA